MSTTLKARRVGWLVAMGILGFGLAAGVAMAGNGPALAPGGAPLPALPDPGAAPAVSIVTQSPEEVLAYWTPERMAEAERNAAPTVPPSGEGAQPETSSTTAPPPPEARATAPAGPVRPIPTVREQVDGAKSTGTVPSGPEVTAPAMKPVNNP